jgi:hypothetical protein
MVKVGQVTAVSSITSALMMKAKTVSKTEIHSTLTQMIALEDSSATTAVKASNPTP